MTVASARLNESSPAANSISSSALMTVRPLSAPAEYADLAIADHRRVPRGAPAGLRPQDPGDPVSGRVDELPIGPVRLDARERFAGARIGHSVRPAEEESGRAGRRQSHQGFSRLSAQNARRPRERKPRTRTRRNRLDVVGRIFSDEEGLDPPRTRARRSAETQSAAATRMLDGRSVPPLQLEGGL
jgi:hypothetical protein